MKTLNQKIELAANVAIIAVALLLGAALVNRYFWPARQATVEPHILTGAKVSLRNVDWAKNGQTLLLVLQKGCHFCSESAPFYQRLVQATASRNNLHLIAVLPQDISASQKYLRELNVAIAEVRQATPGSLGTSGTPTLILVDKAGAVTDSWVGRLPPEKEAEVLGRLTSELASN